MSFPVLRCCFLDQSNRVSRREAINHGSTPCHSQDIISNVSGGSKFSNSNSNSNNSRNTDINNERYLSRVELRLRVVCTEGTYRAITYQLFLGSNERVPPISATSGSGLSRETKRKPTANNPTDPSGPPETPRPILPLSTSPLQT